MNKILIVDDEEAIRKFLNKLLTLEGYTVYLAKNGDEAITILNKHNISVVLLDLIMPDTSGFDILKKIKNINSDIEVIMISGRGSFEDVVKLMKEGAFDFLEKPFDNKLLLSKLLKTFDKVELNLKFKYLDQQYNDIKKLKEYNENIINNIPLGLLTINNEDCINSYNKYLQNIIKSNNNELLNTNIFNLFKKIINEDDKIITLYKNLKNNRKQFDDVFLNNIIDKETKKKYHFRILGSKFSKGIIIFFNDITNEYNWKQRLNHSNKMSTIGQFISSITHGLGNNMANIISNASGIEDEVADFKIHIEKLMNTCNQNKDTSPSKITQPINICINRIIEYDSRLLKRTIEMNSNIKSLLFFSKQKPLDKINSNINTTIEEAIYILKSHPHKQIEFITKLNYKLPWIKINTQQIKDVIIDLGLNGIQAIEGTSGEIKFETKLNKSNNSIQIIISDTGKGIPKDIQHKIFSAFFTSKKNGVGLGLTNVETTIRNHNGTISLKTKNNKGTAFFIELPI